MGITENVYLTGLGSRGVTAGVTDTFLRVFIDGKPGNRLVINQLHCQELSTPSTANLEYIKCMRVLARPTVDLAGAAGTSGFSLSSADIVFGNVAKWGDAIDSLTPDDIVAIKVDDGSYEFDMVYDVSTSGYIELDTVLTGKVSVGAQVYIFGTDTHNAHVALQLSTLRGDSYFDCAMGDEKGDPMMLTNSEVSSTGTLPKGASITQVVYSYVNK